MDAFTGKSSMHGGLLGMDGLVKNMYLLGNESSCNPALEDASFLFTSFFKRARGVDFGGNDCRIGRNGWFPDARFWPVGAGLQCVREVFL